MSSPYLFVFGDDRVTYHIEQMNSRWCWRCV